MIDYEHLKYLLQWFFATVLAAGVRMIITDEKFTFIAYCSNLILAMFAAYLANIGCVYFKVDDDLVPGVICLASLCARDLLLALYSIGVRVSKNPILLVQYITKYRVVDKTKNSDK